MFSRLKNIADKARKIVNVGLVVMAIVKAVTVFADEIDKIDSSKTSKSDGNE